MLLTPVACGVSGYGRHGLNHHLCPKLHMQPDVSKGRKPYDRPAKHSLRPESREFEPHHYPFSCYRSVVSIHGGGDIGGTRMYSPLSPILTPVLMSCREPHHRLISGGSSSGGIHPEPKVACWLRNGSLPLIGSAARVNNG